MKRKEARVGLRVCLFAVCFSAVHVDAMAAPIVFTSTGAISAALTADGVPPPDVFFGESQSPVTTTWALEEEISLPGSAALSRITSTVSSDSVTADGLFQLVLGEPADGIASGGVQGGYFLGFTLAEPRSLKAFNFFGNAIQAENEAAPVNLTMQFEGGGLSFYHKGLGPNGMLLISNILLPGAYIFAFGFEGSSLEGPLVPNDTPGPSVVLGTVNLNLEFEPVAVPEPASLLLLGGGMAAGGWRRWSRVSVATDVQRLFQRRLFR